MISRSLPFSAEFSIGLAGVTFEFILASRIPLFPNREEHRFASFARTYPDGEVMRVLVTCIEKNEVSPVQENVTELCREFHARIGSLWRDALHDPALPLLPALLHYAGVTPEDVATDHVVFGYGFNTLIRYTVATHSCEVWAIIDTSHYHEEVAEMLIRVLSFMLPWFNGFLFHASGVFIGDHACMFFGESGRGKSTILKLLAEHATALSDEYCIVREMEGRYHLFETPWWRIRPVAREITAQRRSLKLFCVGHAKETTSVERLVANEALHRMMYALEGGQQPMIIPDKQTHARQMIFLRELVSHAPCFDLRVLKSRQFPEEFVSFLEDTPD